MANASSIAVSASQPRGRLRDKTAQSLFGVHTAVIVRDAPAESAQRVRQPVPHLRDLCEFAGEVLHIGFESRAGVGLGLDLALHGFQI